MWINHLDSNKRLVQKSCMNSYELFSQILLKKTLFLAVILILQHHQFLYVPLISYSILIFCLWSTAVSHRLAFYRFEQYFVHSTRRRMQYSCFGFSPKNIKLPPCVICKLEYGMMKKSSAKKDKYGKLAFYQRHICQCKHPGCRIFVHNLPVGNDCKIFDLPQLKGKFSTYDL